MWQSCSVSPVVAYSAEEASAMDAWLVRRGFSVAQLMGAAGGRLADAIEELCAEHGLTRVVCLVGPGNNGGDARVAAERLLAGRSSAGAAVAPPSTSDPGATPGDGRAPPEPGGGPALAVVLWQPLSGEPAPPLDARTLLVDGLFGVGLARPLDGAARDAVRAVAASPARVLAVDVPSGLHASTGEVLGVAVRAEWTLSFVGPKQGFFVGQGPAHVGRWRAVAIGFPVAEAERWVAARRAAAGGA